jgi:hypothetical protein
MGSQSDPVPQSFDSYTDQIWVMVLWATGRIGADCS